MMYLTVLLSSIQKIGPGPDNIPAEFLKNCSVNLTPILRNLFVKSLAEESLPPIWKKSFITPVHKSGNRSNVKNYRPISIRQII